MSALEQLPVAQAMVSPTDRATNANDLECLTFRDLAVATTRRSRGLDIVVRRSALSCIRAHGDANPNVDTYGALVGDLYRDAKGPYLLIEQIIQTDTAGGSQFTPDIWETMQSMMEQNYPQSRVVGWYRTGPGNGVYLTESDRTLHDHYFGVPWQAALIYNPHLRETGIFSTRAGALLGIEYLVEGDLSSAAPKGSPIRDFVLQTARCLLALFALGLFAAMGYLLALLVLQIHFHLPPQHFPS
jgi:proteasome lid subunit RPN8/RPN11